MPKLPPEQLEQMRKMGIAMPQMEGGAIVQKMCTTKDMVENPQVPNMQHLEQSGCQTKNTTRNGASYAMDIVCNGPELQGNGTVKGRSSGEKSFSSVYDFNGVAQGKPVTHHQEMTGTWLSADCGQVKPVTNFHGKK